MYKRIFSERDINSKNERKFYYIFHIQLYNTFLYLKNAFLLEMDLNLIFMFILFSNIFTECNYFIFSFSRIKIEKLILTIVIFKILNKSIIKIFNKLIIIFLICKKLNKNIKQNSKFLEFRRFEISRIPIPNLNNFRSQYDSIVQSNSNF